MEYKKNDRKPRTQGGEGTKKYPADRNFSPVGDRGGSDRKSYQKKSYGEGKRPYEGKKPYGDKP